MRLALTGLFRAKWSAAVHEEWICALLRNRPDLSREKLERTRMLMDLYAADALVTGYEDLIEGLQLPDPNDRHVLAAAIRGELTLLLLRICGTFRRMSWESLASSHSTRTSSSCPYSIWRRALWWRLPANIARV